MSNVNERRGFYSLYKCSRFLDRSNARLAADNKRVSAIHRAPASISLLPKLNPSELRFLNVGNTDAKSSNGRKTVLPDIPRGKNSDRKKKESCSKNNPW